MTDKPDGAALVEWLQTWSPVTHNGQRAHLAASELTRLAAERDEIKAEVAATMNRLVNFNLEMTRELSEAKDELTRLAAENRTYAEAHAFNSARFAEMLSERDEAKAEVARLNASLTVTAQEYAFLKDAYDELKLDTEKAEAEIARLREALMPFAESAAYFDAGDDRERASDNTVGGYSGVQVKHLRAARAALKPDTGETP